MSKGLLSYPEEQRMSIAMRRAETQTAGCGHWGAIGYLNKHGIRTKQQSISDAVNEIVENAALQDRLMHKEDKHGTTKIRHHRSQPPVSSLSERSKRNLASYRF